MMRRNEKENRGITSPQTNLVHHRAAIPLFILLPINFGLIRVLTIFVLEEWRIARSGRRQNGSHLRLRENFPFSLHPRNRAIWETRGIHGKTGPIQPLAAA